MLKLKLSIIARVYPQTEAVVAGFSGGVDSLALLQDYFLIVSSLLIKFLIWYLIMSVRMAVKIRKRHASFSSNDTRESKECRKNMVCHL